MEADDGTLIGQAIARIERDEVGGLYGYFSTVYVATEWCALPFILYNTAKDNERMIRLLKNRGFELTLTKSAMIQFKKFLITLGGLQ